MSDPKKDQDVVPQHIKKPDIKEADVPIQVCALAFTGLPRSTYINGQDEDGDCSSTLNPECESALTMLAAQSLDGTDDQCSKISQAISTAMPSECEQFGDFGNSISTTLFQSPSNDPPEDNSTQCDTENIGTAHPLFSTSVRGERSTRGADQNEGFNQTDYDTAIHRVVPFLYSIVSKDEPGTSGWGAKTGLICMRAKDVAAGSRVPSALENSTSEETDATRPPPSTTTPDDRSAAVRSKEMTLAGIIGLAVVAVVFG
ncbi:MAG: hypothetical protein Q9221_003322 [Calogaya cf. arnoldii]